MLSRWSASAASAGQGLLCNTWSGLVMGVEPELLRAVMAALRDQLRCGAGFDA